MVVKTVKFVFERSKVKFVLETGAQVKFEVNLKEKFYHGNAPYDKNIYYHIKRVVWSINHMTSIHIWKNKIIYKNTKFWILVFLPLAEKKIVTRNSKLHNMI